MLNLPSTFAALIIIGFSSLHASASRTADSLRVEQLMDSAFYHRGTDLLKTIEFLDIALEVAQEAKLSGLVASAHNRLGLSYNLLAIYDKAVFHLDKARDYYRHNDDEVGYAMVTSNIAQVHYNLEEYDRALALNRDALRLRQKHNITGGIATNMNNLANIYFVTQRDTDSTLYFYSRAHELFMELGSIADAAVALKNKGDLYSRMGQEDEARSRYFKALELLHQSSVTLYEPAFYLSIAHSYLRSNELADALKYANLGLEGAKSQSLLSERTYAYELLAQISEAQGKYDEALLYERKFRAANDSVFSIEKINAIARIESALQLNQKDSELRQKDERVKLQRRITIYVAAALVFALAMLATVVLSARRLRYTNRLLALQKVELQQQTQKLQAVDHAKNRLFGVISHDLRAPVANLGAMLELFSQEDLSQEEFSDLSRKLHTHFSHLSATLDNLLHWSLHQMKGSAARASVFSIADACDEVCALLGSTVKSKGIKLTNEIQADITVKGDEEQVKIVLRNLISNAVKFTAPGGEVHVFAAKGFGDTVQISVKDSGVGIPSDVQERLLREEGEFTTYGTRGERGTGLGLKLCRDFVRLNQGKFWFESKLGHGSTFSFTLPTVQNGLPKNTMAEATMKTFSEE